jgi:hypothetical protein
MRKLLYVLPLAALTACGHYGMKHDAGMAGKMGKAGCPMCHKMMQKDAGDAAAPATAKPTHLEGQRKNKPFEND